VARENPKKQKIKQRVKAFSVKRDVIPEADIAFTFPGGSNNAPQKENEVEERVELRFSFSKEAYARSGTYYCRRAMLICWEGWQEVHGNPPS